MTIAGLRKHGNQFIMIDAARVASVGVMTVARGIDRHPSVKASTHAEVAEAIANVELMQNDAARML